MSGVYHLIKNRIKSIESTKKITKAMELVAMVKMRKAVESSLSSRFYARIAWELLLNLSKEQNLSHILLEKNKSKKTLLVVIASNRGLCGGYNLNVIKKALNYIENNKEKEIDLIVVGKKAEAIARRTNKKIIASFVDFKDDLLIEEISGLSSLIIKEFKKANYGEVLIAYTDFISGIKYEPCLKHLLPVNKENIKHILEIEQKLDEKELLQKQSSILYLFEPSEERVLDLVLPSLTEVQIYQALLESRASEHSARMMAMKNATENAEEIVTELKFYFNQTRQAAITQEIAEISSAANILLSNK